MCPRCGAKACKSLGSKVCSENLIALLFCALSDSNHALRGALAGPNAQFDWKEEARDALEVGGRIVSLQTWNIQKAQKR